MKPILSVLTPSVPSRLEKVARLARFIETMHGSQNVEHLIFTDNKRRSVGAKRQALLDMARGRYVAFVDDDDDIAGDYIAKLLPRIQAGPDVVTFKQTATINGVAGEIVFDAAQAVDEPWKAGGVARRRPWHVCAWRRELAQQGVFTEVNYGEDAAWVNQVAPLARTQIHIPEVLHFYNHSSATTEAPPPLT